jgi:hypothetical protein
MAILFFSATALRFLVLICLAYLWTFRDLDPDFGWRVKTGELILQRGIPKIDWYSFTMPDFPWIDHACLLIFSFTKFTQILVLIFFC